MKSSVHKDHHKAGHGLGNSLPAGREGPITGIATAMTWQDAWTTAVAIAWSDDKLAHELVKNPRKFLKEYCKFDVPEGITLNVSHMDKADPKGNSTGWDPKSQLWYLKNTELTMFLPPRPALEQQAVAMAAYVGTGRTYPFTIC